MRIAVSGTHCSGKSTLVEDFLSSHPDYVHEPEPYEWLVELYGEDAAEEPGVDDFYRQLELSVERLCGYEAGARVIAERCPLDFLAYIRALGDLRRDRSTLAVLDAASELAARGMKHVDLLVVLPLNDADAIDAPESEDPELREAMNERLLEIVSPEELERLGRAHLRVLEVHGSRRVRLAAVARALLDR